VFASSGALTPLFWFFEALSIAALCVEVWAFVDALRRPAPAFTAANKQTKPMWLIILGVATVIGLGYTLLGGISLIQILPIVAFVAAAIYLTDVRPKVREFRGGSSAGPYGPW
jgi:predicted membrane metal-binding protein